jgi:hypothetical protein
MPSPRDIAKKVNSGGFDTSVETSYDAEAGAPVGEFSRGQERDYRSNPVNPPDPPAPIKITKG